MPDDLSEVVLFHPGRLGEWRYEIRPITVVEEGDDAIITFPSWLFADPEIYERSITPRYLDPNDEDSYSEFAVISRLWYDPDEALQIYTDATCECGTEQACWDCHFPPHCVLNRKYSVIEVRTDMLSDCRCIPCIERVCVHYESGDCHNESLLARLAAALLGRSPCCQSNSEFTYFTSDFIATDQFGKITSPLSEAEMASPFGTKRGGVDAFRYFKLPGKKIPRIVRM